MTPFTSLLVAAGALIGVALLIVGPGRLRRRPVLSANQRRRLTRLMPWARKLDTRHRKRLQTRTARVLRDVEIIGDTGRQLSPDQRLAIAGQVGMLCLGAQPSQARLPSEIIVHGEDDDGWRGSPATGLLEDLSEMATGESWQDFRLHVAWPAMAEALAGGAYNPVVRQIVRLHDFAAPTTVIAGGLTWGDALDAQWRHAQARRSQLLPVDAYTGLDEFFGRAAEAFFQRGEALVGAHPELYDVLAAYFDIETIPHRPAGHRTPVMGTRS